MLPFIMRRTSLGHWSLSLSPTHPGDDMRIERKREKLGQINGGFVALFSTSRWLLIMASL
jgi:hypothetical protein